MNCMGNGRQIVISKASRSSACGRLAGIAAMSLVLALGSPAFAFAAGNGQKTGYVKEVVGFGKSLVGRTVRKLC